MNERSGGRRARWAAAFASLLAAGVAPAQDGPQRLDTIHLNAGIHNITAELARTPEQREVGLMFRQAMGANEGMLFAFERDGQQCFWMKNTLIPLAISLFYWYVRFVII